MVSRIMGWKVKGLQAGRGKPATSPAAVSSADLGCPLKESGHGQGSHHRPWKRCKGQLGRRTDTSSVPPPAHTHCVHPGGGVEEVSSAG